MLNIGLIAGIGGGAAVAIIAVIAVTMMDDSNTNELSSAEQLRKIQSLKSELSKCMELTQQITHNPYVDQSQNERIIEEFENCIANIEDEYVTDEIREIIDELKSNTSQIEIKEFSEDELAERKAEYIQICYESFTGQIDDLNRCLYWADTAIKYGD